MSPSQVEHVKRKLQGHHPSDVMISELQVLLSSYRNRRLNWRILEACRTCTHCWANSR